MSREQKKSLLIFSFSGIILVSLIFFSLVRNEKKKVAALSVEVLDQEGYFFTDNREVTDIITQENNGSVTGMMLGHLTPKTLEQKVEANPFVKDAQVYRDIKGHVQVKVEQSKPIARIFTNGGQDRYIDSEGNIMPVNARHTARVPLVEMDFEVGWSDMFASSYSTQVFELLQYISQNDFWRAQIAHILLKKDGEVVLSPQVTKQAVVFGKPEEIEEKFNRLMTFYQKILPVKGWNTYQRVNVKFENQIICE